MVHVGSGPGRILEQIMAFYGSRAIISAVELDLFTTLAEGPLTCAQLGERIGLHPRGAEDFLDALVALGLLDRADGRYSNNPDADRYLDARKPEYVGGYARMAGARLFPVWSKLTQALRTGSPQVAAERGIFDGYRDERATRDFFGAMDAVNSGVGAALTEVFPWQKHSSFVDLGGARGNLAATLAEAHPHLVGVCLDLPPVEPYFGEHLADRGLADRIRFHAADFFTDPLAATDVFIAGHVLHYYALSQREELLKRVHEALNPGGAVIVYDRMVGPGRRSPALSLLGSLNMVLTSAGGREYTTTELTAWLSAAGFRAVEVVGACPPDTLVAGYKD